MSRMILPLVATLLAGPALAADTGDAAKGEKAFAKCRACHTIESDTGEEIVKGGRTGPNLYGVVGRQAGSSEGFIYSADLVTAGENGLVWDAESFVAYTHDPREFLRAFLDDSKAKSKMTFRLKSGGEDIFAYLASVGPEPTN